MLMAQNEQNHQEHRVRRVQDNWEEVFCGRSDDGSDGGVSGKTQMRRRDLAR